MQSYWGRRTPQSVAACAMRLASPMTASRASACAAGLARALAMTSGPTPDGSPIVIPMRGSFTAPILGLGGQRMTGHQLVGMHPARLCLDAFQPLADGGVLGRPGDAELLRPEQVAAHRQIGDRQPAADRVGLRRQ